MIPDRTQESRRLAIGLNAGLILLALALVGRDALVEALLSKRVRVTAALCLGLGVLIGRYAIPSH